MTKLVVLFACVAALSVVSALECYTCDKETCKNDMKQWNKNICGNLADQNLEVVCQKVTYKDTDNKEIVLQRRCSTIKKGGEAECPSIPDAPKDSKCPICKTDLCNSATTINFSLTAVAGIALAFVGQRYFL